MKRALLLSTAALAAIAAGAALAADLPSRKDTPAYLPPPPPPPLWGGFYAGVNIGGGWSAGAVNPNNLALYGSPVTGNYYLRPGNTASSSNAGGIVGGGQMGYNYQIGSFVLGAETDFQGTSMTSGGNANYAFYPDPLVANGFLAPLSPSGNPGIALNWFGTVRGRAGYLLTPTLLVYGTGGFAYGGVSGGYSNINNTRTGWTAGGGVEWMFMPNWSGKVEYLFADLDSGGTTGYYGYSYGTRHHPQFNIVRVGVNYHFNWGASAPVVAKY